MAFTSFVSLSLLLVHYAAAASVPSTPLMPACSKTECQYTIPKDVGGASSGTLKLWGPEGAIADVSRTAGWALLECNETDDAYAQEIRTVCADPTSGACDDLYHKTGAVGKVVRLPLSCGKNAFARLVSERPCDNQTLPEDMSGIKDSTGKQPTIMRFQLDTNFKAANASDGPVRFAITGANVPGLDNINITDPTGGVVASRHFQQRGFLDWVKDLIDKIKGLTEFDTSTTQELPPLNIDKQFNLLDEHVSCGAVDAGIKIDVGAKANAVVAIGVVASGTIVPPSIDEFMIVSSLTADINGQLDIAANVAGQLSSGEVTLFQAALPGLDFPGILTIGPTFQLNAEATGQLDVDMDITVGVNYQVDKAQFTFPPTENSGAFNIGKTPLTLSAAPILNATGTLEAHLVPKLNLGISALGDVAKAGVFLELDASAGLQLGFNAGAAGTIKVTQNDDPAKDAIVTATASAIADVGGCLDITAGLDVNIGADAKFFNIFDVNKQASLFSRDFQLFEKCFGAATSGSKDLRRSLLARSSLSRRQTGSVLNLLCPAATAAKIDTVSILSGSVDPTEIKA